MNPLKSITLFALLATVAVPASAEVVMNDEKSRLYEADYEVVLAENGYNVGVAVYGKYDADYDVYLTAADVFKPILGRYDADYEVQLNHAGFAETLIASR